jgi:hypothetical protein
MANRLLSFLSDIEKALIKESASNMGPAWDCARMVSYHNRMARMTLTPQKGSEPGTPAGTVFLQSFRLADGSPCLKASLSWDGSASSSVVSVYSKPEVNWNVEASRIASAWLAGPQAEAAPEAASSEPGLAPLVAAVG